MDQTLPHTQAGQAALQRDGRDIAIEYQWISPEKQHRPLIVFLHEGLGCIAMWKDWPAQACAALDCRGLVYSRYGYGQSTPRAAEEQRTLAYLHKEALQDLPAVLDALGLKDEQLMLFGHSDGGSIALLFAAGYPERVRAIAVAAPHIFVEDITIAGIEQARQAYRTTDLREKLGRYHRDVDTVFHAWNDTWLTPAFRQWNIEDEVCRIQCPVLAMQGVGDEYATLAQIEGIKRLLPQTRLTVLQDCGHTPQRDQPDAVIAALDSFIATLS